MSQTRKPAKAFMSYVRLVDKYERGRLTRFRERLSNELNIQIGEDFEIFQDRNIKVGEPFEQRIKESLDEVLLLIPIITPGFFKSEACRAELEWFLDREKKLNRSDLIIPIYYVDCPLLNDKAKLETDKLAKIVASRQYSDWRDLRFEPFTSPEVGRAFAQLATQIRDALERAQPSLEPAPGKETRTEDTTFMHASLAIPQPEDDPSTVEITKREEAKRQPTSRNEPPIRIVDKELGGDYSSIAEAIKGANAGDRIVVRPGVYEEGIIIDKPLEIIGEGELETIVVQAAGKDTISFKTTFGRVVNLALRQMGGGDWVGVDIAQGRLELEGCDISSQSLSCIAIHGGANPTIRRNLIHDGKGSGVYVYDNGQGTLEHNEIFGNALAGIAITNGGNPTLFRNRVHDGKREGIIIYDSGQGTIEENSVFANTFSGVEIRADSNPLLRRNRIYNGKAGGVYVHRSARGLLEDNDIFGNSLAGVAIRTYANPTLRRNFIHDGKQSGIFIDENGQGTIEDNDVFGNAYSGVEIKSDGNPTLRYNRINKNRHLAVWIGEGGGATVEDNDLRGNERGAFYVSADSASKVKRERNQEK